MTEPVKLAYPIEVDGIETDTLHLRRPKVRDIKMMDNYKGDIEKSIALLAALCAVPPSSIEELDAADFDQLSRKIEGFTQSAGQTSVNSVPVLPASSTKA